MSSGSEANLAYCQLVFSGGWTYTGKALNMAYNQLFTAAKGARANVVKVRNKLRPFRKSH